MKRRVWPLLCVDLKSGAVLWTKPLPLAQLTSVGGRLLVLDIDGTLTVAEASPQGYLPISSADVLAGADRPCHFATPPVLLDGRVYCRNFAGDLVCIDMR